MKLLQRIWDSKLTLVVLVVAYAAIEFWGYSREAERERSAEIQEEVAEKVGARLAEQSKARNEKLLEDLRAWASPRLEPYPAPMRSLALFVAVTASSGHAAEFDPPDRRRLLGHGNPDAASVRAQYDAKSFYDGPPIGVGACGRCHADVAEQWSSSAHRFASFNNPYYTAAVRAFRDEKGATHSRFCGDCHDPALVIDGTMDEFIDRGTLAAQAGITCLSCHSIDESPPTGNAAYHATLSPVPLREGHVERVRPDANLCRSCHRVGLTEQVTGFGWFRGQDDWFDWYDSGAAGRGAASILRPAKTQSCVDCHMPQVAAERDNAAKDGRVRSHRFAAANSALAHLRGDAAQLAATREMLRGVVSLELRTSEPGVVDVVLCNRGVGHRFPGGTMDSNQVWVELVARGPDGVLRHSGAVSDGAVDPDAHYVRAQPVDGLGQPLLHRDVQNHRGVVYDQSLAPGDPRVIRYRLPEGTTVVEARLRYRKFSKQFTAFSCTEIKDEAVRARCLAPPIIDLATANGALSAGRLPEPTSWRGALHHGMGLTRGVADQIRLAEPPLKRAAALAPERPEPLLALARAAAGLGQTDRALALLDQVDAMSTAPPARHWQRAMVLHRAYRNQAALAPAEALAKALPDDRNALALLAKIRGLNGDAAGALEAADRLLAVDPEHPDGWFQRMLALRDLKRPHETAQEKWLRHRRKDGLQAELLRAFRAFAPAQAQESAGVHLH